MRSKHTPDRQGGGRGGANTRPQEFCNFVPGHWAGAASGAGVHQKKDVVPCADPQVSPGDSGTASVANPMCPVCTQQGGTARLRRIALATRGQEK